MGKLVEETYRLDGLDFSKTADLLYIKVVVFNQGQEVDLFSISAESRYEKREQKWPVQENWLYQFMNLFFSYNSTS